MRGLIDDLRSLPILDRLCDVSESNLRLARKVRDRARHLEDAGVAARGEAERSHGPLQEPCATLVMLAALAHFPRGGQAKPGEPLSSLTSPNGLLAARVEIIECFL